MDLCQVAAPSLSFAVTKVVTVDLNFGKVGEKNILNSLTVSATGEVIPCISEVASQKHMFQRISISSIYYYHLLSSYQFGRFFCQLALADYDISTICGSNSDSSSLSPHVLNESCPEYGSIINPHWFSFGPIISPEFQTRTGDKLAWRPWAT